MKLCYEKTIEVNRSSENYKEISYTFMVFLFRARFADMGFLKVECLW